jgi:dienelactone hydrolase
MKGFDSVGWASNLAVMWQPTLILIVLGLMLMGAVELRGAGPKPADELPSIPELPNPFVMQDGTPVKNAADWDKRRAELKELIQTYEYGHLPAMTGAVTATEYTHRELEGLKAMEHRFLMTMGPEGKILVHMDLTLPAGKGPFPVIITGDLGWGKKSDAIVGETIKRGYALVEFNRTEVAPDKNDRTGIIYKVAPESADASALAAWAWGYHRVIDYLETRPDIDKAKITITGHSRGGKATLLAGAMDDRIALTVPNGSGCGGAGCYRDQAAKSEAIADILKNFPYWFQPNFKDFTGKVDHLPIDQHDVKAVIAPRALFSTEALGDLWANPEGTQETFLAAKEVYKFLGAEDKIGIHFREGKHEQNIEDWTAMLDFADHLYSNKHSQTPFDKLAFPEAKKPFTWTAPAK